MYNRAVIVRYRNKLENICNLQIHGSMCEEKEVENNGEEKDEAMMSKLIGITKNRLERYIVAIHYDFYIIFVSSTILSLSYR